MANPETGISFRFDGSRSLIARDAELEVLQDAVASARDRDGRLVVIRGAAGMGKTALLDEALSYAAAARVEARFARCSPYGSTVALAAALNLFGPGPLSSLEDELGAGRALRDVVSDLAASAGLVFALDDAQWCDTPSLELLLQLADNVERLPLALVIAMRAGEQPASDDLLLRLAAAPTARELELEALSRSAAERLGRARIPAAEDKLLDACYETTRGNPFLLVELIAELERRGLDAALNPPAGPELVPDSVVRWMHVRLLQLPPGSLEFARAIAVLGDDARFPAATTLAALGPESAARCADALRADAVLDPDEELRFASPLLRGSVYARIPRSQRARMHRRAAQILEREGAPRAVVADHLLAASRERDPWAVAQLRDAARAGLAASAPRAAVRYLNRALEEPPDGETRVAVLVELADAEMRAGGGGAALHLGEALARMGGRAEPAEVLLRLGHVVSRAGRAAEAAAVFERALDESANADGGPADELVAAHLAAALKDPRRARAASCRASAALGRQSPLPAGIRAGVMAARLFACDSSDRVLALARPIAWQNLMSDPDALDALALWQAVACLSWCDECEWAERICDRALREARRRNSAAGVAEALSARAHSRYSRGLIGDALADAGAALDAAGAPLGVWPPPAYLLALCHIERGELEQAATALRLPTPAPEDPRHAFDRAAQGQLALAREDFDVARAAFLAAGAAIEPVTSNPAVLRWQSGAALASARLADGKRARRLVAGELRAAREFGARRPVGVALRTAGVIVGGKEGGMLLREAVATLERSPSRLEQAHALVDLGTTLRRLGLRIEPRERLRHGIELAESCGAVALARRGHEELVAAGARPRRRALRGPGSLTPGERRVVELAARSLTNREIADALFVTRKAVRFHLGNAYKKLEVSGREQLARALEERR